MELRLKRMARDLVKRGVVNPLAPDGLPWALTRAQAAKRLGQHRPQGLRLRVVEVHGEWMISASSVRSEISRR